MKRVCICLLTAALLLSLAACGDKPAQAEIFAMDTVMDLTAYGKGAQDAVNQSQTEIQRLETLLDRTDPDSELSNLNDDGTAAVSSEVYRLIDASVQYCAATGRAFDITIAPVMDAWGFTKDRFRVPGQGELEALLPLVDAFSRIRRNGEAYQDGTHTVELDAGTQVDLGGIAKGYASDRVEAIFRDCGVKSGKVYLGGNVYVQGGKPDGSPWRIGVQDPKNASGFAGILSLTDAYAITSGGYQRYFEENGKRYHHIIDPSTGYPADSGLLSVTVVAPANGSGEDGRAKLLPGNGAMCDAFSTALFIMGEEKAVDFWRGGAYDFDLVLVTEDGRVVVTEGLADRFESSGESGYAYETVS